MRREARERAMLTLSGSNGSTWEYKVGRAAVAAAYALIDIADTLHDRTTDPIEGDEQE